MRTLMILILTSIVVMIAGCGGGNKLEIVVDKIQPEIYGTLGDHFRAYVRGLWDENILVVLNEKSVDPELTYWDEYYKPEHWVVVFRPEENGVIGDNTFAAVWGIYQSENIVFKIFNTGLPIELPLFVSQISPSPVQPNERMIKVDQAIRIKVQGLSAPEHGKDVRVQAISFPSGEKVDVSIKNHLLIRNGNEISFVMPNIPSGDVWLMVDEDQNEIFNFITGFQIVN